MAFQTFGPVPFAPLIVLDRDAAVDAAMLQEHVNHRGSASILIRTETGVPKRGGFFFHLTATVHGYRFHDFGGTPIVTQPVQESVRLINHATGRTFDREMLTLCQRVINMRQDD
jgi:hypothetical protein